VPGAPATATTSTELCSDNTTTRIMLFVNLMNTEYVPVQILINLPIIISPALQELKGDEKITEN